MALHKFEAVGALFFTSRRDTALGGSFCKKFRDTTAHSDLLMYKYMERASLADLLILVTLLPFT